MPSKTPKKKTKSGSRVQLAPHESPSLAYRRQRILYAAIVVAFLVLVAAVTRFRPQDIGVGAYDIESEAVPSRTIQAAFAYETEDLDATRKLRESEAAKVPSTYSVDLERVNNQLLALNQRINILKDKSKEVEEAVRQALLSSSSQQLREEVIIKAVSDLADRWAEDPLFENFPDPQYLRIWMMPNPATIPVRQFENGATPNPEGESKPSKVVSLTPAERPFEYAYLDQLSQLAAKSLEFVLISGVKAPGILTASDTSDASKRVVLLRSRTVGDLSVSEERAITDVPDPLAARASLRRQITDQAKAVQIDNHYASLAPEQLQQAALEMAQISIGPTLEYDQVVTEGQRELARQSVTPAMKRIEMNQVIQREGEPWTVQSRSDVRMYWQLAGAGERRTGTFISLVFANMIIVGLVLLGFVRTVPVVMREQKDTFQVITVVLLITCGTLVLGRIMSFFEITGLAVPLAASAILLAILTNGRVAALGCLAMAILLSLQYQMNWQLLIVGVAMAFTAIASLYKVRRRTDVTRAAVRATVVGLITLAAIRLGQDRLIEYATLQLLTAVGLNGLACLFIAPGLLSPLERLFGITTDIQLLEYSDLNNELLSRLAVEIPATYAHSLMMGQLAEAASDAIGANGLLARVCAYYHDIGKLRRPEYFIENQTGQNIHEDLSPRLSARAIASHVHDGVELAKEYHLPEPIIRGIREHHGTMLISFFYQQALEHQKHGDVRKEDFRYPGPKPQSRETALLMICDGVESGVRTIKNPNEERVREFIDKIIQIRAEDRQFDECDLTLRQLDLISEVLTKRILSTMHTRITYPEKPAEPQAANVIQMTGGGSARGGVAGE